MLDAYLNAIAPLYEYDLEGFQPFYLAQGQLVGLTNSDTSAALAEMADLFAPYKNGLVLKAAHDENFETRTKALADATARLAAQGLMPHKLRGEMFRVDTGLGTPLLAGIDRACHNFGQRGYGVHMNAYLQKPDGLYMWLGRRGAHKANHPNKLDHLAAGVFSTKTANPDQCMAEEAEEEANINTALAAHIKRVSSVQYTCRPSTALEHIYPDIIVCYDLETPQDFMPTNNDGEVSEFLCLPMADILQRIAHEPDTFKTNDMVVILDFALRHNISGLNAADAATLSAKLCQPHPYHLFT